MAKRTFRTIAVAAVLAAGLSLSACGGSSTASTSSSANSGTPVKGQTITWGIEKEPETLNPQTNGQDSSTPILRNLTDSYLYLADDGSYQPWLATGYKQSDDQKTIDLTLRQDVTFSDGEKLDADAVIANFDYYASKNNSHPATWQQYLGSWKKTGDYTVEFTLKQVYPGFLAALSDLSTAPISPKSLKDSKELAAGGKSVALTGPYTIKEYKQGSQLTLEARSDYKWAPQALSKQLKSKESLPYAKELVFRFLPEASTRTGALTSGQVDIINGVPSQDINQIKSNGKFDYYQVLNSGTAYSLYFNTTKAPFNDVNVRKAFQLGADYKAIVKSVYYGTGTYADQSFSPASVFYNKAFKGITFDKDKANKLLDESGWKKRDSKGYRVNAKGERLSISLYSDAPYVRDSRDVLNQAISSELKKNVGIEFTFKARDLGTVTETWEKNTNDAFDNSMSGLDISTSVDSVYLWKSEPNRVFLKNDQKAVDLIQQGQSAKTKKDRQAAYDKLQDYVINDQAYVLPLYIPRDNWAASKSVHGFVTSKVAGHLFSSSTVWKEQ
ncbi:peptide ABC transporter [Bifidobacterium sp. DSM 109960]|uniref:Peptide ABC transporter n=1 Tax=Bifidobacterium erythrocebi TaxID=2675325 RepID=A0A7Y0ESK9_9BIFI|nr:ABC transporter substrate-binding protein [Bifidobacterium sp. DSM 109960]NMM95662.1 peptide ABC transporter [Bifidobacterium sp. DSM 109960]